LVLIVVEKVKKTRGAKKSAPLTNAERQRRYREHSAQKQKKLNAVEPLLEVLRGQLAKIHEGADFEDKVIALEIISKILLSERHGLFEASKQAITEDMDDMQAWAISDSFEFNADEARELNQQRNALLVDADQEKSMLLYWQDRVEEDLRVLEESSEDGEISDKNMKVGKVMLNLIHARLKQL